MGKINFVAGTCYKITLPKIGKVYIHTESETDAFRDLLGVDLTGISIDKISREEIKQFGWQDSSRS